MTTQWLKTFSQFSKLNVFTEQSSTDCRFNIESLHMITDTDGYNYLVLNYSITNLTNTKLDLSAFSKNGYAPPQLTDYSTGVELERCYSLSSECELAYSEIISQEYILSELRPEETRKETCIYKIYNTESDILLMIEPISYVTSEVYDVSIIRLYSFD